VFLLIRRFYRSGGGRYERSAAPPGSRLYGRVVAFFVRVFFFLGFCFFFFFAGAHGGHQDQRQGFPVTDWQTG